MTMYEVRFIRLIKYAYTIVTIEQSRALHIEKSLKPRPKEAILPFELTTSIEVVNKTHVINRAQ